MLRPLAAALLLAVAPLAPPPAAAQPLSFGSADDPLEWGSAFGGPDAVRVRAFAGPTYLPDTWRGGARGDLDVRRGRWSLGLGGTVHPGAGGLYTPEADEPYDAARLLRYLRLNATPSSRVYGRVGPTERVTLGVGALARQYRTTSAWDERAIGAEAAVSGRAARLALFTDDLRLDGVVGGEVALSSGLDVGPVRSVGLTLGAVHDLGAPGLRRDSSLTGLEATLRGAWAGDRPFALLPYATYATYLGKGSTVGGGLEVGVDNAADVLRTRLRAGVFVSSAGFVPGHVGPFYALNNGRTRILDDRSFYDADATPDLVGTPLDSLRAGVDLVLDVRLVAFGRAELSQHFRRHFGPDAESAFGVRVAGRLGTDAVVAFELERQGFRGVFDLIGSLGDQNTLVLDVGVPVGTYGVVFVRSRYGYRRLTTDDGPGFGDDAPPRYLVERRFEPLVGLRVFTR